MSVRLAVRVVTDTHTDTHTDTQTMSKLLHPTRHIRDVGCNEGYDYKLEEKNKLVVNYIPQDMIKFQNHFKVEVAKCDTLRDIHHSTLDRHNITRSDSVNVEKDHDNNIDAWRRVLRKTQYLTGDHDTHISIKGEKLHDICIVLLPTHSFVAHAIGKPQLVIRKDLLSDNKVDNIFRLNGKSCVFLVTRRTLQKKGLALNMHTRGQQM